MALATPSPTLYVSNLETKTKKPELRQQLYALFTPYGKIIDIVAKKNGGMRGQAFIVFEEQAAATAAMRGLTGSSFYERDLRISYSKTPSHSTLSLLDPETSREAALLKAAKTVISNAQGEYEQLEKEREAEEAGVGIGGVTSGLEKRDLEDDEEGGDGQRETKRQRVNGNEEEEEEMEIEMEDEDEDAPATSSTAGKALICTNLPPECTEQIMSALFSSFEGFSKAIPLPPSFTPPSSHPTPNESSKSFKIIFDTPKQASLAVEPNQGYNMQPGWNMNVSIE